MNKKSIDVQYVQYHMISSPTCMWAWGLQVQLLALFNAFPLTTHILATVCSVSDIYIYIYIYIYNYVSSYVDTHFNVTSSLYISVYTFLVT